MITKKRDKICVCLRLWFVVGDDKLETLPHLRSLLVNLRETKKGTKTTKFLFFFFRVVMYYYVMDRHMLLSLTIYFL